MIGELQIFGQFRKSIQWHKDHDFIGPDSEELLQQIIWASKKMRNKLGFNHTTESMLNLGTDAIEECIANESHQGSVVLGCGDMGVKAVETLIDLGETDIIVANRSPQNAIQRLGPLADKVRLMTIQEWRDSDLDAGLLISTIRASEPLEDESYLMNDSENAVVFDFAWPPSISRKCTGKRTLRDMEYWVLKAQHLAREVGLKELQSQGQEYLLDLSQRASESRERKGEAEFRKLTHKELARLASTWIEVAQEKEIPQVQAFSKEIANKITDRHGFITIEEFVQWVLSTPRALEEDLVVRIADDVEELVMDLHEHLPPSEVRA